MHAGWIIGVLILPGTHLYGLVPIMLFLAILGHYLFGECALLLLEYRYRRGIPVSMSWRLFRLVGIKLTEQQVGAMILFLGSLSLVLSLLRWWFG